MDKELIEQLRIWADECETVDFIQQDPIQFPWRYGDVRDIEISAFVTAWLSYGNRLHFTKVADQIDKELFCEHPYRFIMRKNRLTGRFQYEDFRADKKRLYRFFCYSDLSELCETLRQVYKKHDSMGDFVKCELDINHTPLDVLQTYFGHIKGIPCPETKGASKRLNMFLRWMVRRNSPVDFGLWTKISPTLLYVPVDTHVAQLAYKLGLMPTKVADKKYTEYLTAEMRDVFPGDPARGDFAIYGKSVMTK